MWVHYSVKKIVKRVYPNTLFAALGTQASRLAFKKMYLNPTILVLGTPLSQ